jgi:hypothetical protein
MGTLRTNEFRKKYRQGDRVQGRVLTRPQDGLAWVDFNGLPLLARILTPVPRGQRVLFLIASLHPEIVLRQIDPVLSGEGSGDIPTLVRRLLGLRTSFEERIMYGLPVDTLLSEQDLVRRRLAFRRSVQADVQVSSAYVKIREIVDSVNTCLARSGPRRYLYLPWLLPLARGGDLVATRLTSETGMVGGGSGDYVYRAGIEGRPVAATLHISPPRAACRIYCDDRRLARTLSRWAEGWRFGALPLELTLLEPLLFSAWPGPDPLELLLADQEPRLSFRV